MQYERYGESDIRKSKIVELHLDKKCLDDLIFRLISMSSQMGIVESNGTQTDVVMHINYIPEPTSSCIEDVHIQVVMGVGIAVLGIGLLNENHKMGIHNQDNW